MSRTRKLITQIAQVCQELRAMIPKSSIRATQLTTPSQLSTDRRNREPRADKHGTDGKGCTHSTDNKKRVRCEDPHNSLDTQTRHEIPSPPLLPPPTSPSPTSSHSSSEVSASEPSTSSDCQGHSSLDAPSELNPPQRIPSPLSIALLVPQAEG